jgi:lipid-A-disaccharide synthase
MPRLLVCAGEASGDRIAALALRALGRRAEAFGMAGPACAQAGMDVAVPMALASAMGLWDVARRGAALVRCAARLRTEARGRGAAAALLVGFTELNVSLGRWLKSRGVRVLWCVAPQVWAWRPGRLRTLRASLDRLAVILPFEQVLWSENGYDARYVGHPSFELARWRGGPERGAGAGGGAVAVLCGSRDDEARRAGGTLMRAAERLVARMPGWRADVVLAPWLSAPRRAALARAARERGMCVVETSPSEGAAALLHDYELALCVSGTASLEAALCGVPPVVAYRFDPVSAALARALVRTEHIALPNVLLGRRAFPELVQGELTVEAVLAAAEALLANAAVARRDCALVREMLRVEDGSDFGSRVARMIEAMGGAGVSCAG